MASYSQFTKLPNALFTTELTNLAKQNMPLVDIRPEIKVSLHYDIENNYSTYGQVGFSVTHEVPYNCLRQLKNNCHNNTKSSYQPFISSSQRQLTTLYSNICCVVVKRNRYPYQFHILLFIHMTS